MIARANTRVSVLSGTAMDQWGDVIDGTTVAASGIQASLIEKTRVIVTPEERTPRTIRYTVARLPSGTAVTEANRIRDESTGDIYAITSVTPLAGIGMAPDLRLDLKRVT